MLLITNDGRKLALDQRLINPMLPSDPDSKAAKCAENVFAIWQHTADQRSTQMIFCDLSTPKGDGSFSVYDDIRAKLLELGIPENEIAYIHNAKSEAQKKDLFGKVRAGQVRVLLGIPANVQRMGTGKKATAGKAKENACSIVRCSGGDSGNGKRGCCASILRPAYVQSRVSGKTGIFFSFPSGGTTCLFGNAN